MPENPRYQRVPTDNDAGASASSPPSSLAIPPPAYSAPGDAVVESPKDPGVVELPPDYDMAAQLPTYEEAERLKEQQENSQITAYPPQRTPTENDVESDLNCVEAEARLGNDCLFLLSFMIAFVFNAIGFAFAFCLTDTVATKYGAISGIGLSMVKWSLIIRHSQCCQEYIDSNSWIWWIYFAINWIGFVGGFVGYMLIKCQVKLGQRYPLYRRQWTAY